ncbi:hypothetical protein A4X03_0g5088 [Tilletia caries]|uniref:Uncharacterized protein n=1 Tax=Tilletia caries TaxID=13290 RepID=A0A8T8T812_9BASI|nr:hypothetical protein A4X03_0g5088 [Tilletia caries]
MHSVSPTAATLACSLPRLFLYRGASRLAAEVSAPPSIPHHRRHQCLKLLRVSQDTKVQPTDHGHIERDGPLNTQSSASTVSSFPMHGPG